jgi:hypothetical protein
MTAAPRDLSIEQGIPFRTGFTWHRGARDTNGNPARDALGRPLPGDPYDLTGWSGRLQARTATDDPQALVDLTTVNGGIIFGRNPASPTDPLDPSNGRIDIIMTGTQTAAFGIGRYLYDLVVFDPDGVPHRLLDGKVQVDPATTLVVAP